MLLGILITKQDQSHPECANSSAKWLINLARRKESARLTECGGVRPLFHSGRSVLIMGLGNDEMRAIDAVHVNPLTSKIAKTGSSYGCYLRYNDINPSFDNFKSHFTCFVVCDTLFRCFDKSKYCYGVGATYIFVVIGLTA
jgi:hypothetical protein